MKFVDFLDETNIRGWVELSKYKDKFQKFLKYTSEKTLRLRHQKHKIWGTPVDTIKLNGEYIEFYDPTFNYTEKRKIKDIEFDGHIIKHFKE